ncbi:MAG TPA: NAD(P)/FAD-dependent oxidoreductase [Amycolatopsis sp.]|nr:NAD(P)/FAD-dependent oxidoreductase [Amycolatopsis sp.]
MADQSLISSPTQAVTDWLADFERALAARDRDLFRELFLDESYWRDLVAFTWNLRQAHGRDEIERVLWSVVDEVRPKGFQLSADRPAPAPVPDSDPPMVEAFFVFETAAGNGSGLLLAVPDETARTGLRAFTILTELKGLNGVEPRWPKHGRFEENHDGKTWVEYRKERQAYEHRDPEVLIAGGGQHGVMVAAQLDRLGVDALIVDKQERVGDAWRTRYASLVLHQPYGMLHFAHMPFPASFPEYIPKDKVASWFETYVANFDLNFWTSTEFLGGDYDSDKGRWNARIRQADGTVRTMHPKHVVLATGGNEIPNHPDLPGLDDFGGEIIHSTKFRSGAKFAGKKAVIVGAGTSAHDIAEDLVRHGAQVTMTQRNPIIVVDQDTANLSYGDYNGTEVPTEIIDQRYLAGLIYPLMARNFISITEFGDEQDRELHESLRAVGFRLGTEPDGTGWFMRYFRTGGGYYINVGGSQLIANGDVRLLHHKDIDRFVGNGVRVADGSVIEADLVVLATGFKNQKYGIAKYFGEDVAESVGEVWGFDDGGEIRNAWKPTAQPGLWVMVGGFPQARWYSPLVALQIVAEMNGVVPDSFKQAGHPSRTPTASPAQG